MLDHRAVVCITGALVLTPTSASAQDVPRWRLVEELRIGSVDDEATSLTHVGQILVDDDRILVTQPLEGRIRVFALDGSPRGTIGRSGDGPGEYQRIVGLGRLADTLYVLDDGAGRITYLDRDGELLGTQPSRTPFIEDGFPPSTPLRLTPQGEAVVQPRSLGQLIAKDPDFELPLLRTRRDGTVLDTIALLRQTHSSSVIRRERGQSFGPQPFGDAPLFAVADDGSYVVVVDRRVPEESEAPSYVAAIHPLHGPAPTPVRVPYDPIPVPESVHDSVRMATAAGMTFGAGLRETADALDGILFLPASYPPATRVVIGTDRKIWVRREAVLGRPTVRWDILSPNAIPIAWVEAPASLRMLDSRGDEAWASVTDELDVPYVVRFRVERPTR